MLGGAGAVAKETVSAQRRSSGVFESGTALDSGANRRTGGWFPDHDFRVSPELTSTRSALGCSPAYAYQEDCSLLRLARVVRYQRVFSRALRALFTSADWSVFERSNAVDAPGSWER